MLRHIISLISLGLVLNLAAVSSVFAQATGDAFSGFRPNNNSPIQIEADSLEVRDGQNLAVFKGNVDVRQGGTIMRTARLNVFYDGTVTPGGVGGNQGIKRIEASGKVWVNSGNNTATGDKAVFNMKTQQVVLTGKDVILTQCDNIIKGTRLTVNLINNKASISGSTGGGRVTAVFSRDGAQTKATKACK